MGRQEGRDMWSLYRRVSRVPHPLCLASFLADRLSKVDDALNGCPVLTTRPPLPLSRVDDTNSIPNTHKEAAHCSYIMSLVKLDLRT